MQYLKKNLPKPIKESFVRDLYYTCLFSIGLFKNFLYDFIRFYKYSATNNLYETKLRHQGRLIAHYHQIEKGLSLKEPRPGFGKEVIRHLVQILSSYQDKYGLDEVGQISLNVLFSYYNFNLENGIKDQILYDKLLSIRDKYPNNYILDSSGGGVLPIKKSDLEKWSSIDFKSFLNCRYSIRNFSDQEVELSLLKNAVSMAIKTPSVCNRQTWKVYVFSDKSKIEKILRWQTGNRGFGDSASKILIVTSDLNYFVGEAERHQCYIDGGLFAMTLVYSLHSLGLGTCCLNWSVTSERDLGLKKDADIPNSESVIMMIAVGHLPDEFNVAASPRRSTSEILIER